MRIMGQTHGIGADFFDLTEGFLDVRRADGPTLIDKVLVHTHTVQRRALTIQEKTLICIEAHFADAVCVGDFIKRFAGRIF